MALIKPIGTLDRNISKTDIIKLANDHAHQIIEGGNYDLLKTYVEMKRYELYIKTIINKLKAISTLQAQVMREEDQRHGMKGDMEAQATNLSPITPLDNDESYLSEQVMIRKNTIQYASASVQITKKTTYDFTQDNEWQRLTDTIFQLKIELKLREEFLKSQSDTPSQRSENIIVRL